MNQSYLNICFIILVTFTSMAVTEDWTASKECLSSCKCKWINGRKAADCNRSGLSAVPRGLSAELQYLDLRNNNITHLPAEAFRSVRLVNLHKLNLRECNIQDVHEDAFKGLEILIEIDLTGNKIHNLYPGTFRDFSRVREIYLSNNLLQKLEAGLFTNLTYLQKVEVSECQLEHISPKTFNNVPGLKSLKLDGNKLSHIKLTALYDLEKLTSLELYNNPWRCDCRLRPFIEWTLFKKIYARPTICVEPSYLNQKYWNDVDPDQFACRPQIVYPPVGAVIDMNSEATYLRCKVQGDPVPQIDWVYNSRILSNNSRNSYSQGYHFVVKDQEWANLTIFNMGQNDAKGEFKCVAKNPAGMEERNITLGTYSSGSGLIGPHGSVSDSWLLLVVLICGILIILSLILMLCCCFCRKRSSTIDRLKSKKAQNNGMSPNGDVHHHITAGNGEQGKSLLTVVNPVQKPPRRYDQNSPTLAATEMTELNRKLLDDSHHEDDFRVGDSIEDMIPNGRRSVADSKYPPDLLSFPASHRAAQSSPAGSSGSAILPTSGPNEFRLAYHKSPSPIHSPTSYNIYGTLPYSRSQSPFSTPVGNPIQQRQGYVTIPRRPRASWSAGPTPNMELGPLTPEPVYDSYGLRTSADGSIMSLNKVEGQKRQLPNTPNSRHSFTLPHKMSTLPHNYRTGFSPTGESPNTIIRPMPILHSPSSEDRYRSLSRGESGHENPEDQFRRPTSPNRFSPQNRNNDRRRASWTSRGATPTLDNSSISETSDTVNLISPNSRKFTPISIQPKQSINSINNNLNQRISPTNPVARNSPLPFSNSPRKPSNSKPPISPMRKLTPIPTTSPNVALLSAHKPAQSIEILFEDEGEDGTEV